MNSIDKKMHKAIQRGVFPGATLLVAKDQEVVFHSSYGTIGISAPEAVTNETVFDLASLTKALATTPAVMKLVQDKRLTLETTLGELPGFIDNNEKAEIAIGQLLSHSSGLPDHRPYYLTLKEWPFELRMRELKKMVFSEPLIYSPGERVVYSDLGFTMTGWVIELVTGGPLDRYVYEEIYGPLNFEHLFFPNSETQERDTMTFAYTEACPWRLKTLAGEVHDDNAWTTGGILGHTGLFGTAKGVWGLLERLLRIYNETDETGVFRKDVLDCFWEEYKTTGRTPGFDTPTQGKSSSGSFFSARTVGHLGFTGTSFWIDLKKNICVILLTNRVNPSRENISIRLFRPEIHDCILKWLGNR